MNRDRTRGVNYPLCCCGQYDVEEMDCNINDYVHRALDYCGPKAHVDRDDAVAAFEELRDRLRHLARGWEKTGWKDQAHALLATISFPTAGRAVIEIVADDRDAWQKRALEAEAHNETLAGSPSNALDPGYGCPHCAPLHAAILGGGS